MKKKIVITLIVIIQSMSIGEIYAQSGLKIGSDMQAPATDAWNFVKYGENGANLYTGTVNLSIPFYTYKDNDFEIPISFNDASNGLIANTRSGALGPDWLLNVGGCISVDVKGIPDHTLTKSEIQGFYRLHKSGYQPNGRTATFNYTQYSTSYIWGYNGVYLVAKGENLSYSTLSAQVGVSSSLTAGVTADHATVRNNSPRALIDFYEYKPFVGLSKHTNPSGRTLTYSYNLSGKLKAITDENGKLHNEYLYSPDNKQQ